MTERKPHPDNALIDELEADGPAPGHGGRAGGQVNRDVGTRAELRHTTGASGRERTAGQDNPQQDEMKGRKALDRLDPAPNS